MNGVRALTLAIVLALAAGCAQDDDRRLSDSTLVDLLVDLHIVDARAQITDTTGLAQRRDSVFASHSASEREFVTSMERYRDDLDGYLRLYDAVLGRLSEKRIEETRRQTDTTVVDESERF